MVALLASARAFEFMPSGEKELLKTDGGCVKKWDPSGPLECAGVGAGKLVLEPQGLVLPTASNEPHLAFVAEGEEGREFFEVFLLECRVLVSLSL